MTSIVKESERQVCCGNSLRVNVEELFQDFSEFGRFRLGFAVKMPLKNV